MAFLSYADILEERNEYRIPILVHKIFKVNGRTPNFMTTEGLMDATGIIINGKTYNATPQYQNEAYAETIISDIKTLRGATQRSIQIKGNLVGNPREVILLISKFEKSEEMGGQPSGGKKVNLGTLFEKEMTDALAECLRGDTCDHKYASAAKYILDYCSKINGPPERVEQLGGKNESRPFGYAGGNIVVLPALHSDHAKKLTDVNIYHKGGKISYLSLKFGGTTTFVNSGVKDNDKPFPEKQIRAGQISNPMGIALLEALGIDNSNFCEVFNLYESSKGAKKAVETHKVDVSGVVNRPKLKAFLQTAIGSGYFMVHNTGSVVDFYYMNPDNIEKYANVQGPITLYYGGKGGKGKRIDMEFSNPYFDFILNIRNKGGQTYPSHCMLDYKSKEALGKTKLK